MTRLIQALRPISTLAVLCASATVASAHTGADHGAHHSIEMGAWALATGALAILGYRLFAARKNAN
ncbi:MAG: hypothetical protein ACI8X5_002163 [Planctomycetota bacterium]|jgi:hypothetical protein